MPNRETFGARVTYSLGRWKAAKRRGVNVPRSCLVHPASRINPRNGRISLGERCTIAVGAAIQGSVDLGDDCSLQMNSMIVGYGSSDSDDGRVQIGNGVRIAANVLIIAANHIFSATDRPIWKQGLDRKTIEIGDDVWIAGNVVITAGSRIGSGCVIGAGSVVIGDIPRNGIAVGSPAKVVRQRDATSPESRA
ncbi:acyltransferase [Allorhodopirellula heiligendammensis]|uniref:acyltransferase n=1 Tax=Allorhodopirellula heiligendammensis TaxID=2714739 RepID=UPI00345E4FC1